MNIYCIRIKLKIIYRNLIKNYDKKAIFAISTYCFPIFISSNINLCIKLI